MDIWVILQRGVKGWGALGMAFKSIWTGGRIQLLGTDRMTIPSSVDSWTVSYIKPLEDEYISRHRFKKLALLPALDSPSEPPASPAQQLQTSRSQLAPPAILSA